MQRVNNTRRRKDGKCRVTILQEGMSHSPSPTRINIKKRKKYIPSMLERVHSTKKNGENVGFKGTLKPQT